MKLFLLICLLVGVGCLPCTAQIKEKKWEKKPQKAGVLGSVGVINPLDSLRNNSALMTARAHAVEPHGSRPIEIPNSLRTGTRSGGKDDSYSPVFPLSGGSSVPMPGTVELDRLEHDIPGDSLSQSGLNVPTKKRSK